MAEPPKPDQQNAESNDINEPSLDDLTGLDIDPSLDLADDPLDFGHPNVDAIINERDELKDRLLRALADAENARKRGERDRRDAEVYGGTRLARDLLAVYDNLNRALETVDETTREQAPGLIEGIELTLKELVSAFGKHKIETLNPEFGERFDPKLHQAMFEAPVPNAPAGTIIQVMNVGFTIGERLLRPAQVGVSSTPADQVVKPKEPADGK